MKRGFNIFLVFVLAVLVSNKVLIKATDKGIYNDKNPQTDKTEGEDIYNEKKLETVAADDKDIDNKTNPKTVDDEDPKKLKRKRTNNNEEYNDYLKGIGRINAKDNKALVMIISGISYIERIHTHLLFMVCDYLHIDDTSRFHRTSNIIHEKLLVAHASVHEVALRQFMRMVRTPLVYSSLYNTTIGRKRAYVYVDRKQYQLMKRYQRFVEKNDMSSVIMKKTMFDVLSTTIPPPVKPSTLNAHQPTFRYLYLEKIENMNDFLFEMPDGEIHFTTVSKDNDDGASKLIPHLNGVPVNVLLVFDVWTTMCYLRKPNTKEFISFRYNMPAFFATDRSTFFKSRYAEHYIHFWHFWNHKIKTMEIYKDGDIGLTLIHGNGSYFSIGLEVLDEEVTITHYYYNKDGEIQEEQFFKREDDTIYFPKFNSEE